MFNVRLEWVLLSTIRFTVRRFGCHNPHGCLESYMSASSYLSAALQAHTVPLFLEGPTRRMKVLKTKEEKKALYEQVG